MVTLWSPGLGACWGTATNDNMCLISNNLVQLMLENTTGVCGGITVASLLNEPSLAMRRRFGNRPAFMP